MSSVKIFYRDESGLELSEYAAAAALITLACIMAISLLSSNIADAINALVTRMTP